MAESSSSRPISTCSKSEAGASTASNVTLRGEPEPADYFPCPICRGLLPVRTARTGKPYLRCDPCGMQLFVRGSAGIRTFSALVARSGIPGDVHRVSRALEHFADLGDLLHRTQEAKPFLGHDADLELQERLILAERDKLRKYLLRELREIKQEMREGADSRPR